MGLYHDFADRTAKLIAEGVSIPTYALRWVASSYLEQREPEIAVELYRQVLAAPDADPAERNVV